VLATSAEAYRSGQAVSANGADSVLAGCAAAPGAAGAPDLPTWESVARCIAAG